jgi:hypothetical protein
MRRTRSAFLLLLKLLFFCLTLGKVCANFILVSETSVLNFFFLYYQFCAPLPYLPPPPDVMNSTGDFLL